MENTVKGDGCPKQFYYAGQLSRFAPVSVLAGLLFLATVTSSLEAAPGLATPSLSANAASSSQVLLKWSYPASGISGYIIEKSLSSNSGFIPLATLSSKATSYTDSGLASANTFYYRMRAYKQSNLSSYSPVAFATTPAVDTIDTTPPLVPAGLTASPVNCQEISLVWTASTDLGSGVKGYNIYRNGALLRQATAVSTTSADTGLNASTSYSYSVSAVDNAGNESAKSNPSSATTPVCPDSIPPSIPAALIATAASCQQIDLLWNTSTDSGSGMKAYNIYRNGILRKQVLYPSTSASDSGLSALTGYSYTVTALDNVGNESAQSSGVSATTPTCPDTTPPTIPTGVSASAVTCNQINVTWSGSTDSGSGVKGYNVYRNSAFLRQVLAPATTTPDTALAASTSFSYAVTALDNAGTESGASSAATATTPPCSSSPSVIGTLIDSGTLGESTMIGARGRMAEIGGWQALLYDQGYTYDKYLYIRDDLGNTSWVYMPDLTGDMVFKGEYVFTSVTELWVFSSNGMPAFGGSGAPAVARQYALQGSPLPTSATLVSKASFGDSASGAGSFIKLKSGGLAGLWYRPNPNFTNDPSTNWVDLGFVYRSPAGIWSSIFPVRVEGLPNHTHSLTLVQHPADNSIWAFSKGDSFPRIWSMHLTEAPSGLSLDWVNSDFITQVADGNNGPEGEIPYLTAIPDPSRNAIQLAYQNSQYKFFSTSPFVKGAFVSIAQIQANGAKTFVTLPRYVERISTLALIAMPDGIWLGYRPVNANTLSYNDVYASSYSGGAWGQPMFLGTTAGTIRNLIAYGVSRVSFALGPSDWTVHLFDIK